MRIQLSVKFFAAFLVTSITVVALMIAALQFYARQNFSEYVRKVEAQRLSELAESLRQEYLEGSGWERLRGNPGRWHRLLRPLGSAAYREPPPAMPPGFEFPFKGLPPNQPPRRDPPRDRPPRAPRQPDFDRHRPPERPPGIEHRLALFDRDRQPVIGRADSVQGHTLQEIAVDGETVGWLGLRDEEFPSDPLGIEFMKQQAQAFYLVGALALAIAGIMALLLARHLHSPLRQLIQGTRSLTSRRFDARIEVTSSDELGELARDFNRMAQTHEHYEQLRRQWISDIAHELRTPIAVLQGEIEALQDGIRPAGPGQIASLHAEVVHIGRIVQGLHELSLAESDALNVKKEPLDIVALLRACIKKFESRFAERRIEIADELGDAGATALVAGDTDRLTQVFSNLLENTLRYTDPPGRLSVSRLSTLRDALVYFADTPPGVPTEALPRLFERLYRVDASRSRAHGGSGLGLSICKSIVEAHGGSIVARHAPSGGLMVEISIPLIQKTT